MSILFSLFFAILIFSFLIFVHELGHFVTAKLSGVQVNEFSLFMGPAIFKKQVGETLYAIRSIPVGGYCAMEGEDGDTDNPRSFQKAAWWKRLIILVAGSAMNFIAGVILFFVVLVPNDQFLSPEVAAIEPWCTIAGEEGIQVGDRIWAVDGSRVYVNSDFSLILTVNPGDVHDLVLMRDGEKVILDDFRMERHPVTQEDGSQRMLFGFSFTIKDATLMEKIRYAWDMSLSTVSSIPLSFRMIFSGQAGVEDVTGVVGIVHMMSDTAANSETVSLAVLNMLSFGAFLAINLAVMNLLPIPALDGGRVFGLLIITLIETIIRRKINPKYEGYIHGVGMVLLLALMALITLKDVVQIFRG